MDLSGKRVLVTGASGEIGRALVNRFLGGGAEVAAHCFRNRQRLEELAASLPGAPLHIVQADLGDQAAVRGMMDDLQRVWGDLDILVNNAGGARPCPLPDLPLADWEDCLRINLTAPLLCVQAALPALSRRKGTVINIASVAGLTGGAFGPHYGAAKAGLIGLTRSMARELGPLGIRVNAVAPGPVDSEMTRSLSDKAMGAILAATALGRVVLPDEVADAVLWLAAGAEAITGQTLVVDGGRYMH